jgi:hypothetical protein
MSQFLYLNGMSGDFALMNSNRDLGDYVEVQYVRSLGQNGWDVIEKRPSFGVELRITHSLIHGNAELVKMNCNIETAYLLVRPGELLRLRSLKIGDTFVMTVNDMVPQRVD